MTNTMTLDEVAALLRRINSQIRYQKAIVLKDNNGQAWGALNEVERYVDAHLDEIDPQYEEFDGPVGLSDRERFGGE